MRLLFLLLTFLLFAFILGFVATNLEESVTLQVFETEYEDVPLYLIGILAVFVGIAYAGIIAVAEGAHIRLSNRRMAREVRKLETELNYLRTQPPVGRAEPDTLGETARGRKERGRTDADPGDPASPPPSAPVYGDDDPIDDDDMYSGGRAV